LLDDLRADLDDFPWHYSEPRTRQGKPCQGNMRMATFLDGLPLALEKRMGKAPPRWDPQTPSDAASAAAQPQRKIS